MPGAIKTLYLLVFFFFSNSFVGRAVNHKVCGSLVSWPGIEPAPRALKTWSLNHWTTREVPHVSLVKLPQVFSISLFYTKRNRCAKRLNDKCSCGSFVLLSQMMTWTWSQGQYHGHRLEAVTNMQCLGHGKGWNSYTDREKWKPEAKIFFPIGNEKPLRNLCMGELWYIESEIWKQMTCVSILFCFYFSSPWLLCLNSAFLPLKAWVLFLLIILQPESRAFPKS